MQQRTIGNDKVGPLGLGCMNLSHAYGCPPEKADAIRLLHAAFDLGIKHFDTAALYGFGHNETLIGEAFKGRRQHIHLASKCAMTGVAGKRVIDGRPATLMRTIDAALQRLNTDYIDLYYLHRCDKDVPIEESVGALSRMVEQGKIGGVGLSEVSADTLRRASIEYPITALQSEYSLWTRNPEIAVLNTCRELDVSFIAFSPLARGFLCAGMGDPKALEEKDIRRNMPRFQENNRVDNMRVFEAFRALADEAQCSPGQLALNWMLCQDESIVPILGTRSIAHLKENLRASELQIDSSILRAAGNLVNQNTIKGARYPPTTQAEIDTEEFGREEIDHLNS